MSQPAAAERAPVSKIAMVAMAVTLAGSGVWAWRYYGAKVALAGQVQQRLDARQAEAKHQLADLDRRIAALRAPDMLSAGKLTTPEGRAASRATLAAFRQLVTARTALVRGMRQECDNARAQLSPRQASAVGCPALGSAESLQAYAELERIQVATADAAGRIIDWAEQQGDGLRAQGTAFVINRDKEPELESLFRALKTAAAGEAAAVERANRAEVRRAP
ncbi:MAG: hypothetical protein ACXU8N_01515 [Telluria sp.]